MPKTKNISDKKRRIRPVETFILLLFVLAMAVLAYLFIESLQTSRDIKDELNTKTSVKH